MTRNGVGGANVFGVIGVGPAEGRCRVAGPRNDVISMGRLPKVGAYIELVRGNMKGR
jgi:hypothetical protein